MTKTYVRLSLEEREEISRGLACGEYLADIAERLHRNKSTISREVNGRKSKKRGYRAASAQRQSEYSSGSRRKGYSKVLQNLELEKEIQRHILLKWSPEQIVSHLKKTYSGDTTMHVSHETIYTYVHVLPKGELKRQLLAGLRQQRKYRRKQKKQSPVGETRGKLADMLSIEERPKEIADRIIPGHWEGDLILGKNKRTALGTLVERTTRFTLLVPLKEKDAVSVRKAFVKEVKRLPEQLRQSLTYDQGKEMGEHKLFTRQTKMQVYFAHPGSPWERGTNENTNGLVRQFFPKGTDFSQVTTRQIKTAQRLLNGRPRKTLGFETPAETFNTLLR